MTSTEQNASEEAQTFRWVTNLYMPFDRTDRNYLAGLKGYKVGAPQVAARETALSLDEMRDFNIVGIYALGGDRGVEHTPLEGHLAKYLDDACHFTGRQ